LTYRSWSPTWWDLNSPDRARPISKLAAEVTDKNNQFLRRHLDSPNRQLHQFLLRGYERAADVAEQAKAHGIKTAVPFLVTPGSEQRARYH